MPKLTLFTSVTPLTKTFWADGRTEKNTTFYNGTYEVIDIPDHTALQQLIESLSHYQGLCYSIPLGYSSGGIVTQGNENEENGTISRTKKYFYYQSDEGWLFIDCDQELTEQEVITRLSDCYPAFASASYVYATSASHQIDGTDRFHLYFKVQDISTIKQATDTLFNLAFKQGYGFCKIGTHGACLNRTFFDKAVFDPARLDYISGPYCVDFDPPERDIRVVQKENEVLDLSPLLCDN